MRKAANIAIIAASLGVGSQYALDDRWWVVLACGLAGTLWLFQSKQDADLIPAISTLFLVGVCGTGTFLNYNLVWLLTSLVVILIAWDLDRFTRDFEQFSMGQASKKDDPALFRAHLVRLGIVVILGWSLGVVALNVQVSFNLPGALILGTLALLSLRLFMRFLDRESDPENP